MTSVHNFIENDPCHGCDYAKLKEKIDNPFERRYCCTNVDRVHYTINYAKIVLDQIEFGDYRWDEIEKILDSASLSLKEAADMCGSMREHDYLEPFDNACVCPHKVDKNDKNSYTKTVIDILDQV